MPCAQGGDLVICSPPQGVVRRKVMDCPVCERRTRHVIVWQGAYYAEILTCCRCGDSWSEGWRMERPFARGWRKAAVACAREDWASAMTPGQYRAAVRRDLQSVLTR